MNHVGRGVRFVVVIGCGSLVGTGVIQARASSRVRNPTFVKMSMPEPACHTSTMKVPSADSITRYSEAAMLRAEIPENLVGSTWQRNSASESPIQATGRPVRARCARGEFIVTVD